MGAWETATLADLIEIKHGYAFQGKHFCDDPTGDVLVTPGNFSIGGGFQLNKPKFYNGPVPGDYVLTPGDVIVTMTDLSKQADTLGFSAIIPEASFTLLHNQRIGKVALKSEKTDLAYIAWLLRSTNYRNMVVGSATGSTVKHTSPSRILEYQFKLPPLPEQQAIAAVLSALDDKIELNRRMNETLEASARALFRDWFVDFGPVKAKAAKAPATLAPEIWSLFPAQLDDEGKPEGWEWRTFSDVAVAVTQKANPTEIDADTPYIGLEHMPRQSIALDQWEGAGKVSSAKSKFKSGHILFGKLRPYFHKVGIAPVSGICSTDIVVMEARRPELAALALACASTEEFVAYSDQSSTGTKMPRTSWSVMGKFPLVLANKPVNVAFEKLIGPMIEIIMKNIQESRTLAQTRDRLLPKLMSGEIRVADAAREIAL